VQVAFGRVVNTVLRGFDKPRDDLPVKIKNDLYFTHLRLVQKDFGHVPDFPIFLDASDVLLLSLKPLEPVLKEAWQPPWLVLKLP